MNLRKGIFSENVPWMTLTLFTAIWVIYLFALASANSEFIRESLGIEIGKYYTYVTHAFVHADLFHIFLNSLGLLAFGAVVEQQVKRYWFLAALVGGVLVGAIAGVVFPVPTHMDSLGPVVGFSAVVYALVIMGIGVLIRHWRWGTGMFRFTIGLFTLLILAIANEMLTGELEPLGGIVSIVLLVVGMPLSFLLRRRHSKMLFVSIPIMWVLLVLTELATAEGIYTSAAGHSLGAVVGAILLIPVLQSEVASQRSLWLQNKVRRVWIIVSNGAKRAWEARENKSFNTAAMMCVLLVTAVLIYIH